MGTYFGRTKESSEEKEEEPLFPLPLNLPLPCGVNFRSTKTSSDFVFLCNNFARNTFERIAVLHRAIELEPNNPLPYVSLCNTLVKLSTRGMGVEDTTRCFIKVLVQGMNKVKFHEPLFLALLNLYQHRLDSSMENVKKELENFPQSPYAHFLHGLVLNSLGKRDEFLESLMKTMSLMGDKSSYFVGSSLWLTLSNFFLNNGDAKLARYYLQNEKGNCNYVDCCIRRVQILHNCGERAKAIDFIEKEVQKCSYFDVMELFKARISLGKIGTPESSRLYEMAVKNNPLDVSIWRVYSRSLLKEKKYEKSLSGLNMSLKSCENLIPSDWYMRGVVYYQLRRYRDAEVNFRIAILLTVPKVGTERDKINVSYRGMLGDILSTPGYKNQLKGDWKEVYRKKKVERLALLQKSFDEDPSNDDIYFLIFLELIRFYPKKIETFLGLARANGSKKFFWGALRSDNLNTTEQLLKDSEKEYPDWLPLYTFKSFFYLKNVNLMQASGKRDISEFNFEKCLDKCYDLTKTCSYYNHFLFFMLTGEKMDRELFDESLECIEEYEKMLEGEFSAGVAILKSQIYRKSKDNEKAEKELDRAINFLNENPNEQDDVDLGLFYSLLAELFEGQKRYELSLIATKYSPALLDPYRIRAKLLREKGRVLEAIKEMNRAIYLRPRSKDFVLRSELRFDAGDLNGAECDVRVAKVICDAKDEGKEVNEMYEKMLRSIRTSIFPDKLETFFDVIITTEF